MKIMWCIFCVCWLIPGFGQSTLKVSTDKTTTLVFPCAIRHVDRGSKDVLVQQVKVSNILLVKAAGKKFPETNLSVVTEDGSVYAFTVNYSEKPDTAVYYLPAKAKGAIASYATSLLANQRAKRITRVQKWDVCAAITGIHVKDNACYFQISICNRSNLDYDIDQIRFYVRDRKTPRRTAVQEDEKIPLYIAGNHKQVKACSFSVIVVALEKFTIPDAKLFAVQVSEKNGGRHLKLKLGNNKIIKAMPLPDLH